MSSGQEVEASVAQIENCVLVNENQEDKKTVSVQKAQVANKEKDTETPNQEAVQMENQIEVLPPQDEPKDEDQENSQLSASFRKKDFSNDEGKESVDQNDNNRTVPTGKKCFNTQCNSRKIFKKLRSRVYAARYRFLCKTCYENYIKNCYCQYCEQIYPNEWDIEEDHLWIGCDTCQRWNHVECERKYGEQKNISCKDSCQYECRTCAKKAKGLSTNPVKRSDKEEDLRKPKVKFQINREQRVSIFYKKEQFPCLQYFLQGFNYRLWMPEGIIKEDLETLRQQSTYQDDSRRGNKKVKLD